MARENNYKLVKDGNSLQPSNHQPQNLLVSAKQCATLIKKAGTFHVLIPYLASSSEDTLLDTASAPLHGTSATTHALYADDAMTLTSSALCPNPDFQSALTFKGPSHHP